ncbi:DUF6215 domain-containing protein [Streptomyces sp. NBC_01264]|uniref:DUF6215 domain-containing protein n=1 Tax=Streptomyces sp. NBC_01264 TaxID=2903804 RepID=UPI00225245A5|nr:DUF6215 domain-containing protein [Streptomyces sp. NBC_01264]MCX4777259.1 DUF6215 domain-containing protein [Streptomyces sp. NBC_01264]
MTEGVGTITTGAAIGQGITAVVLIGGMGLGLWVTGQAAGTTGEPKPVACPQVQAEKTPGKSPAERTAEATGSQLCAALHRPDLPSLLGTPGEVAKSAGGGASSSKPAGSGEEIHTPTASVEFETYTVHLRASRDGLTVATVAGLLGDGKPPRTVLGRPATFYSDRTLSISFRLDGSDTSSGPGVPTRALVVAMDPRDGGGSYELTLWRSDGTVPDDAVVLRVAEQVLPTVPGFAAAG